MENLGVMSTFLPDEGQHSDMYCEECQCFVKELCWLHATTVPDAAAVPLAVASLPDVLYFTHHDTGKSVHAKRTIRPHTIFGPLIAHGHTSSSALKLDNDFCCNWMKFVSVVGQWEEPNLRLLRRDDHLVFVTVKVILPGEELKLAVEPRYMPQLDSNPCKPTKLAAVHLHIPDSLSPVAETDSGMLDNLQCDVNIVIDDVVEEYSVKVSVADAVHVHPNLPIEADPLPVAIKYEPPSDREASPEYPFSSCLVVRNDPKGEKDRKDAGRYPLRSRAAVDAGNPQEVQVDPLLQGSDVDDSDVDADYRFSDGESSTDSENESPPTKRRKLTHATDAQRLTCEAVQTSPTRATTTRKTSSIQAVSSDVVPQRNVYPSDMYRFICPECTLHFLNEQLLQWHRHFQHWICADTPWKSGMKCTACTRSYAKRRTMVAHVEQHGVRPERIKHYRATNDPRIMRHVAAPSDTAPDGPTMDHEPHTLCFMNFSTLCQNYGCSLRFCSEELAAVHEIQHVSWKTYQGGLQCPGCGFTAENSGELVEHVTQHGAGREDRKMCRLCGEFKVDMQMHMVHWHKTEYEQFVGRSCLEKCSHCGKSFHNLKVHITLSHTAKPVQCFICAKQFPSTNALKKHCEEHKTPSGFTCPTCEEPFPTYRNFSLHTKKHDILRRRVCEVCQAVFPSSTQLAQHMLGHGSDYKFRCEACDKKFKRSGDLWQHNKYVHGNGMKQRRKELKDKLVKEGYVCPRRRMDYEDFPYKCQACRLGWLKLGGLEQHQIRKHAVDRTCD